MGKRRKLKRGKSKRLFSRTASKTKRSNLTNRPMRGGGRL